MAQSRAVDVAGWHHLSPPFSLGGRGGGEITRPDPFINVRTVSDASTPPFSEKGGRGGRPPHQSPQAPLPHRLSHPLSHRLSAWEGGARAKRPRGFRLQSGGGTMVPPLHTAQVTLRQPDHRDATATAAFLMSDRSRLMGGPYPRDRVAAAFALVPDLWAARGFGLSVWCLAGSDGACGLAGPWMPPHPTEPGIGCNIRDGAMAGRGFATKAVLAAPARAFDRFRWATAVSYIHPDNLPSARLAERVGARIDPDATCPYPPPVLMYRHPVPRPAGLSVGRPAGLA